MKPSWPRTCRRQHAPDSGRTPTSTQGRALSKSAVSRVVATLKTELAAWRTRSLADVDAVYLYLDAFALRVRSAGKVVSVPVLGVVGVRSDRKSTRLNSSHLVISYAVFCLKKKNKKIIRDNGQH